MSKPILAICHAKHMQRYMILAKLNYVVILQRIKGRIKYYFTYQLGKYFECKSSKIDLIKTNSSYYFRLNHRITNT